MLLIRVVNAADRTCGQRSSLALNKRPVIYRGGELLLLERAYLICVLFEKFWLPDALAETRSLSASINFALNIREETTDSLGECAIECRVGFQ